MPVRPVLKIVKGQPTSDGAGVRLTRMLGTPEAQMFDPFLMLDCFDNDQASDYLGGFPDHPHRDPRPERAPEDPAQHRRHHDEHRDLHQKTAEAEIDLSHRS